MIWVFGWHWADAVASIAIGVLVIYSAWDLVKQAVAIPMESTPGHLDIDAVRTSLVQRGRLRCPRSPRLDDYWRHGIALGHAVLAEGHSPTAALKTIRQVLHEQFGITHVTIQIESADHDDCGTSFNRWSESPLQPAPNTIKGLPPGRANALSGQTRSPCVWRAAR